MEQTIYDNGDDEILHIQTMYDIMCSISQLVSLAHSAITYSVSRSCFWLNIMSE